MTPELFESLVDVWVASVKAEAVALFRSGVAADYVMKIAVQIHDAKVVAQSQRDKATAPKLFVPRSN